MLISSTFIATCFYCFVLSLCHAIKLNINISKMAYLTICGFSARGYIVLTIFVRSFCPGQLNIWVGSYLLFNTTMYISLAVYYRTSYCFLCQIHCYPCSFYCMFFRNPEPRSARSTRPKHLSASAERPLSTKIRVNKIRTDSKCSQSGTRTTKFHCEEISFVQSTKRTTKN